MENFIFWGVAQIINNMAELTIKNPISQQKKINLLKCFG